jgi:hypothetical protein
VEGGDASVEDEVAVLEGVGAVVLLVDHAADLRAGVASRHLGSAAQVPLQKLINGLNQYKLAPNVDVMREGLNSES